MRANIGLFFSLAIFPLVVYLDILAQMPLFSALAFCVAAPWLLFRLMRRLECKTMMVVCLYFPVTLLCAVIVNNLLTWRAEELRSLVASTKSRESAISAYKSYCNRPNSPCRLGSYHVMFEPDLGTIVFSQFMERRYVLHIDSGIVDRPTTAY